MKTAVFTDIDGTLYSQRFHEITPASMHALKALMINGIDVYPVTSRSIHELAHARKEFLELPFSGWIVEGGALILDQNGQPVESWPLEEEEMEKLAASLRKLGLYWRYSTLEKNCFDRKPPQSIHDEFFSLYLCVPEVKSWNHEPVYNVLIWSDDEKQLDELETLCPHATRVRYPGCLEILAASASKDQAVGLIAARERYGRVICIGDGENDVEMLKAADLGIAMGNGCQNARDAARTVALSIDEDGFSKVFKEKGLI